MALKIVFMGTPDFALPILKSIHKSEHRILKVYTQNPKKKDRGQKISLTPVHEYSNLHQIEVSCPKTLDTEKESIDSCLKDSEDLTPSSVSLKLLTSTSS